jgi:hypothetical protein
LAELSLFGGLQIYESKIKSQLKMQVFLFRVKKL